MSTKITKRTSINEIITYSLIILAGIFLVALGILSTHILLNVKRNITYNSIRQINGVVHLDTATSKFILKKGLPLLEKTIDEDDPVTLFQINWSKIYWRLAANIKSAYPLEIIRSQIPLLALTKTQPKLIINPVKNLPPVIQPSQLPETPSSPDIILPKLTEDPVALIYHTHATESYIPTSGKAHLNNQLGDVVKVGSYLQQILEEKFKLKCIQSKTIHDKIPFRESYNRSHMTVLNHLQKYPATKILIDLHRDATPGLPNNCIINGTKCATISFVVGSDKMGLPHPRWKENYEFVKKLNDNIDLYYPGLSNGIIISDARYNQHMHTRAVLVEFGNQFSTLEDAYNAVDYFAEVLAYTLNSDTTPGQTTIKDSSTGVDSTADTAD